jgi:hypothetical protein
MITSDRGRARTRNTTIIVAVTAFNAGRTLLGVTFSVAELEGKAESRLLMWALKPRWRRVRAKAAIRKIVEPESPARRTGRGVGVVRLSRRWTGGRATR